MTATRGTGVRRPPCPPDGPSRLDRRRFLVVVGGSAAYAALRPHAAWARRAARGRTALQSWTLPAEAPTPPYELARALVGAAVLAPSHWNTQPWRFEVEPGAIRLVADARRALPTLDPTRRSMMVSLGAALENLLVAARAYGLHPAVSDFPHDGANGVVAQVTWTGGGDRRDRAMFHAIAERRTNRRSFDGRGIYVQNRGQLLAQIHEGLALHWLDDRERMRAIGDVVFESVRAQVLDRRAQLERRAWMRRGEDDAERRGDGVSTDALELGGPAKWLAGRYFNPNSRFIRLGAESAAKQAREGVRTAGALALLAAAPGGGERAWLQGGQAYERLALRATMLGIAHQPLSEPLEVAGHRGELVRGFEAADGEPLLLVRLGHARRPRPTPRRAVAVVASFRNS